MARISVGFRHAASNSRIVCLSIAPLRAINPDATVIPLQADIVDKNGPNCLVGRGLARTWKINNCGWVFVRVV